MSKTSIKSSSCNFRTQSNKEKDDQFNSADLKSYILKAREIRFKVLIERGRGGEGGVARKPNGAKGGRGEGVGGFYFMESWVKGGSTASERGSHLKAMV